MCKNLNIGIVLFLIIGLVMSGCIRKLNLYQGDKGLFFSKPRFGLEVIRT